MSIFKIFLSGKMAGLAMEDIMKWRNNISSLLLDEFEYHEVDLKIFDPPLYYNYENNYHQTEKEVMQFDLNNIRSSNIVIVNTNGLSTSVGSMIEVYEAYKNNIPVIALDEFSRYDLLHPWIQECITRVENSMCDVVNYIRDFYIL